MNNEEKLQMENKILKMKLSEQGKYVCRLEKITKRAIDADENNNNINKNALERKDKKILIAMLSFVISLTILFGLFMYGYFFSSYQYATINNTNSGSGDINNQSEIQKGVE